jgi:hypothetical protein
MTYWQIAAGSEGRDYAEDFLRFGMAFVGGDAQRAAMKQVCEGDCVLLKRGKTHLVAAGTVVRRNGIHSGDADKQWLADFDGWQLHGYCYVDWHKPEKPRMVSGFTRNTIQKVWKEPLKQAADSIVKQCPIHPRGPEPKPVETLGDEEILDFLITEGLRPGAAEDLTQAFRRIRLLANYYYHRCNWRDIREHETRTFLIMPLLLALGWSEQQLKIELGVKGIGRIDIACFSRSYVRDGKGEPNNKDCVLIIETKGFSSGLTFTHAQAKQYAAKFPSCKAVIVSNGYCYKTYPKDSKNAFSDCPSAYLNLLSPKKRYPIDPKNVDGGLKVLKLLLTQSWR